MPMRSLGPWVGGRRGPSHDLMSQFEEFINEFDRGLSPTRHGQFDFSPAVDLEEKDNAYIVTVDLPGIKRDEIKVDLSENILTISGERKRETQGEGKYTERYYGKFERSFSLPNQIAGDKVKAEFKDGVLKINLPKAEGARSQSIKVM
ncbi:Hsp20/alpha crystallin family protein [Bdellovibrio sp. 22V]|uniref:Hsp20/alpha crystallin family protein n=1 Tax=Bdellovibrio TaxID=958 RepID=UPI0025427141|nr:Hsp20/alpha crystallin family protein [Bdellovibrio sp. 22V]WII72312.1 Hsp20/alpha crystallin family protein [Bdellovibrio sp. 22V]